MQGIITLFINRNEFPDHANEKQLIDLVKEANQDLLTSCNEAGYKVMFITTTGEASRIEKIDFDQPFQANRNNSVTEIVEAVLKYHDEERKDRKRRKKMKELSHVS